MIKKISIIFVFITILSYNLSASAATIVKENSKLSVTTTEIENLIEENKEDVWTEIESVMYDENYGIIYKLGANEPKTELTVINAITEKSIIRILKNGYSSKTIEELGVDTEEDAYLATNIALMAIENRI